MILKASDSNIKLIQVDPINKGILNEIEEQTKEFNQWFNSLTNEQRELLSREVDNTVTLYFHNNNSERD